MFNPAATQLTSIIRLKHRTQTEINGQPKNDYVDDAIPIHPCEFKPFYGLEAVQAGQMGITDGGTLKMWYTPGVKFSDRVLLNDDPDLVYDVQGVENVGNRRVWLVLKVKRVVTP